MLPPYSPAFPEPYDSGQPACPLQEWFCRNKAAGRHCPFGRTVHKQPEWRQGYRIHQHRGHKSQTADRHGSAAPACAEKMKPESTDPSESASSGNSVPNIITQKSKDGKQGTVSDFRVLQSKGAKPFGRLTNNNRRHYNMIRRFRLLRTRGGRMRRLAELRFFHVFPSPEVFSER